MLNSFERTYAAEYFVGLELEHPSNYLGCI